ncbi:LIM domain-binding protein 2 isoform X2 [Oopsacas minuta]|uniref:LIM domain-binding protein 2 isoform X2 n=1 Tax=Oopsacas minuta TaxID=111878 RepID=A0AAV7K523_9METZ|nr:LIM domain-binding protein 2 isoform X2 [Oopsacas minuta]
MNHTGVIPLGTQRNLPYPLPMNQHYSTLHRYYPKTQFMPHATQLDTILAPPNYYDISLPQANQIRVHQMAHELPLAEVTEKKTFKMTHCDTKPPQIESTHGDIKSRIERRITELNTQLQYAPRDPSSPWWDEFADNFFHTHSTILVLLPQNGKKDTRQSRFHLEKTPLAAMEFFKNLYEHQVSQVGISLKSNLIVTENTWTDGTRCHAPEAVLFTEHHKPQSVKVTTEGSMSIIFTPQLKIQHLEFDIKSATEFVARKNFHNLNKSGLHEMRANSLVTGSIMRR